MNLWWYAFLGLLLTLWVSSTKDAEHRAFRPIEVTKVTKWTEADNVVGFTLTLLASQLIIASGWIILGKIKSHFCERSELRLFSKKTFGESSLPLVIFFRFFQILVIYSVKWSEKNLKKFSRGKNDSPKVSKVTLLVTIKVRISEGFLNTVEAR